MINKGTGIIKDWLGPDGKFLFGKHAGKSLESVILQDYAYVKWIVSQVEDISDEDRAIMESQLSYRGKL